MAKINFQDLPSTSTPLNATNLNAMQNIDFASLVSGQRQTIDLTSWTQTVVPLNTNATFSTSNSNVFTHDGNGIKCNFSGQVLILEYIAIDEAGELDLIIDGLWNTATDVKQNTGINIISVSQNDVIQVIFLSGLSGNHDLYDTKLFVIRLS